MIGRVLDSDLNPGAELPNPADEPVSRHKIKPPAKHFGQGSLIGAAHFGGLDLGHAPALDEALQGEHQFRLVRQLLGVREPKVGKDIAGTCCDVFHFISLMTCIAQRINMAYLPTHQALAPIRPLLP